jgi:hypothetical protein
VATLFECFLRRVATCLGNFVSAGLCLIKSLSILACLSRGLQPYALFLVRDDGRVGNQRQSIQSAFI